MIEITFCPTGSLPGSVDSSITPTHSIPRILGNVTEGDCPSRVKISEWLTPRPMILTRDQVSLPEPVFPCKPVSPVLPLHKSLLRSFVFRSCLLPHHSFLLISARYRLNFRSGPPLYDNQPSSAAASPARLIIASAGQSRKQRPQCRQFSCLIL